MTTPQPEALPAHPGMFAALAAPNFRPYVSGQSLSLWASAWSPCQRSFNPSG